MIMSPIGTGSRGAGGFFRVAVFFAAHAALGILMLRAHAISTVHAAAVLMLGLACALLSRSPVPAVFFAAYIAGAEVLWRITQAGVFWEFGKYAASTVLLAALWRLPRPRLHGSAILYMALLLPSVMITLAGMEFAEARQHISFNLSGPFALVVGVCFFSNVRLSSRDLFRTLTAFMGPVFSVATITLYGTLTATHLRFTNEGSAATSGGFGPNQVSSALGLGAFCAFFYLVQENRSRPLRLLLLAVLVVFAVQSAMTFSRGGLYVGGGAALLALWYLARKPQIRSRILLTAPLLAAVAAFAILPRLDTFTGGALSNRFRNTNLTHRDELLRDDVLIFLEHPLFGAGPGMERESRRGLVAHTEFSRLLSEHGLLGVAALLLLVDMALRRVKAAKSTTEKAHALSFVGWSFLYMAVNGMRLVAPSFTYALAWAELDAEAEPAQWRLATANDPQAVGEPCHEVGPGCVPRAWGPCFPVTPDSARRGDFMRGTV